MTIINSVLGPVNADDLGFTLMHEHLLIASAGISQNFPELIGASAVERIARELKRSREAGITTIVDATTIDLGRDIKIMSEASRLSGVNIIACAGWWMESPFFLIGISPDQLSQLFVREIKEGICGTNIKSGILKAASDSPGVTEWQETVLRAVARAHHQTDVPIMLHSYSPGRVGERQIAILKEEGVDLTRVKMDHSNDTTDIGYLTWLLEQGCYLGMDRFPGKDNATLQERYKTVKNLIDAGYADRLLLSHDFAALDISEEFTSTKKLNEEEEVLKKYGFPYMKKVIFPNLQKLGVSKSIIDRLCITGPRNFFSGK